MVPMCENFTTHIKTTCYENELSQHNKQYDTF